jgi:polysaccharide chain length determinant protein (PEP-CTERM system associated)
MSDSIGQIIIYLRAVWKHRWLVMIITWVVAIAGWGYVARIPEKFQASTRVYIDTDSVLRPLLKGLTVETDVEQRLQLMTRTLLSRPKLEKLIHMTHMDIYANTPAKKEALIGILAQKIKVENAASSFSRSRSDANLYTISYEDSNREVAKRVVQSLLSILVNSSLGDTREDSTTAREFLDKQIKDYEQKLTSSEDRLAEFKRKNMPYLPNREGDYLSSLRELQDKYDAAQLELREAKKRRDTLKQQLIAYRKTGVATTAEGVPILTPIQERIKTLQAHLDELSLRFTENHPDVQELKRQIAALKKKEKEPGADNGSLLNMESNPMFQQLSLALGKEESNISAAEVRVNEYANRMNTLKQRIENLQQVEVELNRLDRDYNLNKKNYTALVNRRDSAKLSGQAEQTGEGIKFRIVDPPWVPQKASHPKRNLLDAGVLLFAIAAGIGMALFINQLNPVFYGRNMLQEATGVAMFGGVSRVYNEEELANRRKGSITYVAAGTLLLTVFMSLVLINMFKLKLFSSLGGL